MPLSAQKQRERRVAQRAAEAQRVRSVPRTLVARILVARIGCAAPLSTASRAGAPHMRHDVERGARRLTSLLPSTTTTAATVGAFARALRGRVLTSCRGCHRYSSDEGRGKGCSGDGPGGEARPATGPLPPPTAPGPCTRRRLAANFPCLRATRLGSTPKHARL